MPCKEPFPHVAGGHLKPQRAVPVALELILGQLHLRGALYQVTIVSPYDATRAPTLVFCSCCPVTSGNFLDLGRVELRVLLLWASVLQCHTVRNSRVAMEPSILPLSRSPA